MAVVDLALHHEGTEQAHEEQSATIHEFPRPQEEGVFDSHATRHALWVDGARIHYTLEAPDELADAVPSVLIPGNFGIEALYKDLRTSLVRGYGKPAVTLEPPRIQWGLHAFDCKHLFQPDLLLARAGRAVMDDLEKRYGYSLFDIHGHSMGGPAATKIAERYPEKVRRLGLEASAGIEPDVTVQDFIKRLPEHFSKELLPILTHNRPTAFSMARFALSELAYASMNPWRTLAETWTVMHAQLRPGLEQVDRLKIPVSVIQFPSDRLINADAVRAIAATLPANYEEYNNPEAGHLTTYYEPSAVAATMIRLSQAA